MTISEIVRIAKSKASSLKNVSLSDIKKLNASTDQLDITIETYSGYRQNLTCGGKIAVGRRDVKETRITFTNSHGKSEIFDSANLQDFRFAVTNFLAYKVQKFRFIK